ncbi:glycosyltransferase family 4 protein [Neorhizobium alkalisoli]|uniref:Glycosyltransferase involved in cell wall biosynthesis n=1 Tax=Neorhizobium alkalisoli TaxID=528178 RepID=A0A561R3E8_9HYPH|nr:glycosyltransferase family 1 protein [Neorhizobium alkalisoli]TWF57145.1 glycosyltransferase involved in cell wall biosynthesis [Neorhizobium alkalisoli]
MSSTRIMIDGYNLALEKGTGVATYSRNLSLELSKLGHKIDLLYGVRASTGKHALMSEVNFFDPMAKSLKTSEVVKTMFKSPLGLTAREVPITGRVIAKNPVRVLPPYDRIFNYRNLFSLSRWHFRVFGRFMETSYEQPADIAHWTYPLPIRLKKAQNIYTIHDLVPLRLPYTTLDNKKEYYRVARDIARHADHIVTVSEASKRDIVDLLEVPEERVTNTYQSVSLPPALLARSFDEVAQEVEAIFGLEPKKYFLFFGAIEPKKNVSRIIEAYLASQSKYPLVVVGQLTWKDTNDLRLLGVSGGGGGSKTQAADPSISAVSRAQQIIRLEYLPLALLTSIIRCARAVVFPSLYEGFGLPILEAMQLGTAVITGTEGSNPEVAGDSAYLVDPYDVGAIAQGIRDMQNDDDMVAHYETVGKQRAEVFSPERYSERLDALYKRLK